MPSTVSSTSVYTTLDSDRRKSFFIDLQINETAVAFLIDSGADKSILPKTMFKSSSSRINHSLVSATNEPISSYGIRTLSFKINNHKAIITWEFIVADVSTPILGADFLAHHDISVNCNRRSITFTTSGYTVFGHSRPYAISIANRMPQNFNADVQMNIDTKGSPTAQKSRRLFGEKFDAVKKEFDRLLDAGIIRPSKSEWASPLVVVKKQDGSWRPCGDYRQLNEQTIPDKYPLPRIQDLLDKLGGSTIFSKLDLKKAFHQIPIAEKDIHKTAVITSFGLYEYCKMPFGLKNCSAVFQRFMDTTLRECQDFTISYVDDILIFSKNETDHEDHIKQVISVINSIGLDINADKCIFRSEQVEFLGFRITRNGVLPKTEIIITDQGRQFESQQFEEFCKTMGIEHRRTTAYHPQSNGKIERWHRTLKNALRAASMNANKEWIQRLPKTLLFLRNCMGSDNKASPSQLTLGANTRLPGDIITSMDIFDDREPSFEKIKEDIKKLEMRKTERNTSRKSRVNEDLLSCEKVWLKVENLLGLNNLYEGPFQVLSRSPDYKTFKIDLDGSQKIISIDRLKPAILLESLN